MAELTTADDDDPLFIERLQAFLDKNLADLHAFSKRENRPFDQVRLYVTMSSSETPSLISSQTRRRVADWHARYLFHPQPAVATNNREYSMYHWSTSKSHRHGVIIEPHSTVGPNRHITSPRISANTLRHPLLLPRRKPNRPNRSRLLGRDCLGTRVLARPAGRW